MVEKGGGGRDARLHCSSSTRRIFPRFPLSGFQLGDDGFAGINSNSAFSCQRVERVAKKEEELSLHEEWKKSSPRGSRPRIIFSLIRFPGRIFSNRATGEHFIESDIFTRNYHHHYYRASNISKSLGVLSRVPPRVPLFISTERGFRGDRNRSMRVVSPILIPLRIFVGRCTILRPNRAFRFRRTFIAGNTGELRPVPVSHVNSFNILPRLFYEA